MTKPARGLSLSDLEAHDPQASSHRAERRFWCPFCGGDKKQDAAHRSLSVHTQTGLWKCHRCAAAGRLREWDASASEKSVRPVSLSRQRLARACVLPPIPPPPTAEEWERTLLIDGRRFQTFPLEESYSQQAARYLTDRGIAPQTARSAGARFCANWWGRPAVTFPLHDSEGRLTAAQGRYIDGRNDPKTRSAGEIARGVFACAGAWDADIIVLTEAPLDALSLAVCDVPALALCGKDLRPWLLPRLAFRRVLVALDADEAGDQAAAEWLSALRRFGADARRLRPEGGKDWNELLSTAEGEGIGKINPNDLAERLTRHDCLAQARNVDGKKTRGWIGITLDPDFFSEGTPGYTESSKVPHEEENIEKNAESAAPRCTPDVQNQVDDEDGGITL